MASEQALLDEVRRLLAQHEALQQQLQALGSEMSAVNMAMGQCIAALKPYGHFAVPQVRRWTGAGWVDAVSAEWLA